ncbi:MAG TPA: glycogen debranching N-terminal domain-containing protein [Candidatus Polarisedimenticolia bacterium]|nr:glycogen debranching N-terminal domain-containing protein [Candidatus Polarisedimenticolia bacterium]
MTDVIRIDENYYVLATSALTDARTHVLKQGETFAIFDRFGNINAVGLHEQGLFHKGTRYLSRGTLRLGSDRLLLLSSTVLEDNARLLVDLTNPDITEGESVLVPRGTLHFFRSAFLRDGVCHQRIRVANFGEAPAEAELVFHFDADFVDIFEVRGARRAGRGERRPARVSGSEACLSYQGLDGVVRAVCLSFSPAPGVLEAGQARFPLFIPPRGVRTLHLTIACEQESARRRPPRVSHDEALAEALDERRRMEAVSCRVSTTSERFNEWLNRSIADVWMMTTFTSQGPYPDAGVPWYSTPFGRDGIITALQMLWIDPSLARGVLRFLAATQAASSDPEADAEPGKILHEMREGEMAALGEIPFRRYYGSVDATPLFIMLAAAYYKATADRETIEHLWPHVERALAWIASSSEGFPGGPFLAYARRSARGLAHQGWKDSQDAVFHADGSAAEGPIALCEAQAYVHAALRGAALLARALGRAEDAGPLEDRALDLRRRFDRAFWSDRLGTWAMALDGRGRRCDVLASNAGHCLFAGIAPPERAAQAAAVLLSEEMFSGWGIRTVGAAEARFNPMSYHNGSVWPHDNALIAQGLARYGRKGGALTVLSSLFDATHLGAMQRLPELFCGFPRRAGEGPTRYPVACAPQSWAAGAVFMLLRAVLGLSIDAPRTQLRLFSPALPPWLHELKLENLRVGQGSVDLVLHRYGDDVGVSILRREGPVEIAVFK